MVVIPAGSFMMGSPENNYSNESPRHPVTIAKPFAVAKYELTFDEWDTCVTYGDCPRAGDRGWGRGRMPVIYVSWDDARSYVGWLSRVTGKSYRLVTEAEYEYAARAGMQTAYPWGDDIKLNGKAMANCSACGGEWDRRQTAPVGSFEPNGFGLYDMVGNVLSWVEDCYHPNYNNAPMDGSAWTAGDCPTRVIRSGSWYNPPRVLRSASRNDEPSNERSNFLGFRVARTLTP
jgi:formylglycine-generating enzyme required for sulfatase activity